MSVFDGFIGASYVSPSAAWDAQRAMNLFLEADESGSGKSDKALLGTPGLAVFDTLPTAPVRGVWTGLADALPGSTATDLAFAVAGPKLYSVTSGGGHSLLGDVGDDAAHSPCTFQVNGTQLLVTSAGLAWVQDALGVNQAFFNNGVGTVDTLATAVTLVSGDPFDATLVGSGILIAGVAYVITAYVDPSHVTLGSTAGTQTGAAYRIYAGGGTVDTSGTAVTGSAGDAFTGIPAGAKIVIGTTRYTVASVTDATHLILTGSAGTQTGAAASYPRPVLAAMSAFLDGYGIVLPPNSKIFYICGFNAALTSDFSLWNLLDFGRKAAFPDNIASILADHEELWIGGSEQTEIWRNTGNADFPFQRDPGAIINQGMRAPFSLCPLANGVVWIGGDTRGNPIAWRATGYTPARVSTHGVETAWAGYSTVTDAVSFSFTLRGHQIWRTTFPTANATWDYDATAGTWNEVGWWNGATIDRHRALYHGYGFGKHLVGDWATGKLYELSEAYYDDAGTAIHRIRTAPHLTNEDLWTFYDQFRLAIQAGIWPTLSWSDDLGITWHAEVLASNRLIGGASQLSVWRRLGKARDRVWRMTVACAAGTLGTVGTAVTWTSGDTFATVVAGMPITINGVTYTVQSVTNSTHLVLTASAGTQVAHAFSAPPASQVAIFAAYLDIEAGS